MKIDSRKLDIFLARECKSMSCLRSGTSPQTLRRIRMGNDVQPKTVGRIAKVLNCDPVDILEGE